MRGGWQRLRGLSGCKGREGRRARNVQWRGGQDPHYGSRGGKARWRAAARLRRAQVHVQAHSPTVLAFAAGGPVHQSCKPLTVPSPPHSTHATPDRLMGFKENSKEVAANLPHVMQRESY